MRIHSTRLRLPTDLPCRLRLDVRPFDVNGWTDPEETSAPRSSHSPTAPPASNDDARFTRVWNDHTPHKGRRPPQKGVANFRGSTTDAEGREIVLESTLERAAATILLVDRNVARLRSQVGPVHHVDEAGKEKRPIFDFVADGRPGDLAIAIKPERKRVSSGIDDTIAKVRVQRPDFTAEATVWTEEQLPRCAEHNAGLILRSRRLRDETEIAAVKEIAGKTRGTFCLGQLVRSRGGTADAFAAAVNLIDDGILVPTERGRIRPELKVRFAA